MVNPVYQGAAVFSIKNGNQRSPVPSSIKKGLSAQNLPGPQREALRIWACRYGFGSKHQFRRTGSPYSGSAAAGLGLPASRLCSCNRPARHHSGKRCSSTGSIVSSRCLPKSKGRRKFHPVGNAAPRPPFGVFWVEQGVYNSRTPIPANRESFLLCIVHSR